MTTNLVLDPRLSNDCYLIGNWGSCLLLLMNNAAIPWFILVPKTTVTELYLLPQQQQEQLQNKIKRLSEILQHDLKTDKINVASIGNIVSQLHIHVVGRFYDDYCWPNVVWGAEGAHPYRQKAGEDFVDRIRAVLDGELSEI